MSDLLYTTQKSRSIWKIILKSFFLFLAIIISGAFAFLGVSFALSSNEPLVAKMLTEKDVEPHESIILSFNERVDTAKTEASISISPETKITFVWNDNNHKLEIKPVSYFSPGEKYLVTLRPEPLFSVNSLLNKQPEQSILSFKTSDSPRVLSIEPVSGESNVKIDSNVIVRFDKPVTGYDINFKFEPFSNFSYQADPDKKTFTILTGGKLAYANDYAVSVEEAPSVAGGSEKKLPEVFRANFKTEIEQLAVPDPAPGSVVSVEPDQAEVARIKEGKYIDINLKKQNLSIFEDSKNLGTYKISSGKRGYETPTGTFSILAKRGRAWSKQYKLFMPYFMLFTKAGHGIHELPEWPGGAKEGAAHLGRPVSHGCVRLGVGPAKAIYEWAQIGTPVVIHY
jgi:lipoprotein-anchoring transpeptidase ErfK/SrfK